jgi:hypothetical protein
MMRYFFVSKQRKAQKVLPAGNFIAEEMVILPRLGAQEWRFQRTLMASPRQGREPITCIFAMLDQAQLTQWKQQWRRLVADSIAEALSALEERLPDYSPKFKVLIALRGQLNDANSNRIMGVLSSEALQLEYNRLRKGLLDLIEGLNVEDFLPQPLAAGAPAQRGFLLHKIPGRMEVKRETACIIRLAYEQAAIARDLELDEDVEVKQVTVSKVMHAELIDPNSDPAFAIRSFSDEEQFLQAGEYTEWKFFVRPLRPGAFKLLIKVSVVERVEGQDRRRNLSWEEKVQVVTQAVEEVAAFQPSGIVVGASAAAEPRQAGGTPPPSALPHVPVFEMADQSLEDFDFDLPNHNSSSAAPVVEPAAPAAPAAPARTRRFGIRRLSIAATVLLAIGMALFYFPELYRSPAYHQIEEPAALIKEEEIIGDIRQRFPRGPASKAELEEFIKDYPQPVEAEALWWEMAKQANDSIAYQKYLEQYPDGKFAQEAKRRLTEASAGE